MSSYFDSKQLFQSPTTTQYGSHMIMTDVSKETKKKIINIDTRFRDEYNYLNNSQVEISYNYINVSNYYISLPDKLTNVKSMKILNAEIPVSYFNISSTLNNNTFRVTNIYPSSPNYNKAYKIIIPDGQYTTTTIQQWLNNYLQTYNPSGSSLELSDLIYKNSSGDFSSSTNGTANNNSMFTTTGSNYYIEFCIDETGNFDKYNLKSKLGWILGFRLPSYVIYSGGSFNSTPLTLSYYIPTTPAYPVSVMSESILDLNGSRYLYLVIDEFQNGNQNSFISPLYNSVIRKNIIARITTDNASYPYGTIIPANLSNGLLTSDKREYNGKIDIQRFNIQLINEFGKPLNLNGYDFSICLLVEYE